MFLQRPGFRSPGQCSNASGGTSQVLNFSLYIHMTSSATKPGLADCPDESLILETMFWQ